MDINELKEKLWEELEELEELEAEEERLEDELSNIESDICCKQNRIYDIEKEIKRLEEEEK